MPYSQGGGDIQRFLNDIDARPPRRATHSTVAFRQGVMTMPQRPRRERAELALTATFAWREAPTSLFSPALRVQVERILTGIDEVEAAISGLRSRNPAVGPMSTSERVRNALASLSHSLITARSVAGPQTLLIHSVFTAFRETDAYIQGVELSLNEMDSESPAHE